MPFLSSRGRVYVFGIYKILWHRSDAMWLPCLGHKNRKNKKTNFHLISWNTFGQSLLGCFLSEPAPKLRVQSTRKSHICLWSLIPAEIFFGGGGFFMTRGQRVGYRCPRMVPAFNHSQQRPLPIAIQVFPAEISLNPQHHDDSVIRHFCYSRQNSQMAPKIPPAPTLVYISCISPSVCVEGKGEGLWIW